MHPTTKRRLSAACLAALGSGLMVVPALDLYRNVADGGAVVPRTVLENSVPLLLSAALIAFGYWLFDAAVAPRYAAAMVKWCVVGIATSVAVVTWLLGVQSSPATATSFFLYGYVAILGAAFGSLVGYHESVRSSRERQLRAERNQFVAFFENVPSPAVGITYVDGEPIVEHVNAAFEDVFGYEGDRIRGDSLDEYVVPPEKRREATDINRRVRDGQVVEREVQRRTADSFRTFVFKAVPVAPSTGQVDAYVIYDDVTDQREQRQRLQVLYRVLRHDLRNRMNVVKGTAEIILEELTDPDLREWAEALTASAEELIELSSQTRQIERSLDAGDYSRRTIDAAELVREVLDRTAERYPDVEIERDVDDVAVVANDLIDAALENAVENAFQHNDSPDPAVTVTLRAADENYAEIVVADNGPGVPESERQLFEGDSEITQLQHASGLGLWLLNWIVTQSGGAVEIRDNDPRGTAVVIRLPRSVGDPTGEGRSVEAV